MTNDEINFINKINKNNDSDLSLFPKGIVEGVHKKIINKLKGIDENKTQKNAKEHSKADIVIQQDIILREAVKNLAISLEELNDKEIAKKLIGEHIIILSEIFKTFE